MGEEPWLVHAERAGPKVRLAREAGVTAIVGLGASPGLTNLLSLAAMNELDSVREVYTGWDLGSAVPEEESAQEGVNAAMVHAIQQITGTVKVCSVSPSSNSTSPVMVS